VNQRTVPPLLYIVTAAAFAVFLLARLLGR
jgi:hypothetical protein